MRKMTEKMDREYGMRVIDVNDDVGNDKADVWRYRFSWSEDGAQVKLVRTLVGRRGYPWKFCLNITRLNSIVYAEPDELNRLDIWDETIKYLAWKRRKELYG